MRIFQQSDEAGRMLTQPLQYPGSASSKPE